MKASLIHLIASVLLLFFAASHTFGFRSSEPEWGAYSLIRSMREIRFLIEGFSRTYWNSYVGIGLFVSVLLLFAAFVSWQLGGFPVAALLATRGIAWVVALCSVIVNILSWRYFIVIPIVFSILINTSVIAAAWLSGKPS